jgi:deoxyribodipyrimidine photo-lyase
MWLAAYTVHWRRVRWQAGARWFLSHLLDGDPASNNLSWQWVASTFSHKPYMFNRQNLERFTNGVYCRDCPLLGQCAFEGDYETLAEGLFPGATQSQPAKQNQQSGAQSPARKALARVESTTEGTDTVPRSSPSQPAGSVVWIHGDNLNPHSPALRAEPNTPAIWVWDDALLTRQQIGLKRILFLYECLLDLPVTIRRGNVAQEVLRFAVEHDANQVATMDSVSPGFAAAVAEIEQQLPVTIWCEAPFVDYAGTLDLRRFSRYWRRVQHLAQT